MINCDSIGKLKEGKALDRNTKGGERKRGLLERISERQMHTSSGKHQNPNTKHTWNQK